MRPILALMVYTETEAWSVQVGGPRALSTIVRPYHMDGGVSWKPALLTPVPAYPFSHTVGLYLRA